MSQDVVMGTGGNWSGRGAGGGSSGGRRGGGREVTGGREKYSWTGTTAYKVQRSKTN